MKTNSYNLFRTKNNFYLYIPNIAQFFLIHPLMFYLLKQYKEDIDVEKWIKSINKNSIRIENYGIFSKKDIKYQYDKMLFFISNLFDKIEDLKLGKYTGKDIEKYIANSRGITFEVTENCNLSCDYCIYGKYYINKQTATEKVLSFEIAKNMINYFVPIWESSLNSSFDNKITIGFYGGEALLNFNLIKKIIDYVKTLSVYSKNRIEFSMTTNGVLLDKYISFLVNNNFFLKISLDGGTEKENSFRKYHNGKIAFKTIYSNVLKIKEKYPLFFEKNVNFISVLHCNNSESKVTEFFSNTFNKKVLAASLSKDGLNPNFEAEFWKMFMSPSANDDNKISKQNNVNLDFFDIAKFIRFYCNYVKHSYLNLLISNKKGEYCLPTGTCEPFKRMIFVTSDGKILPCERIGHQFALGNISVDDINIDFNNIADKYNNYYNTIFAKCKKCLFKLACGQCMFQTDNFDCQGFMEDSTENYTEFFAYYFSAMENNPQLYLKTTNYILI